MNDLDGDQELEARKEGLPSSMGACLAILGGIQEQIRYADSKAGFITVFNVLLLGFIASRFDQFRAATHDALGAAFWLALGLVVAYLAATVSALLLAVTSVISRFGGKTPQSRVFFVQIAAKYADCPEAYAADVSRMSEREWLREIGNQIVEVSAIATAKHVRARHAGLCSLASLALWVLALAAILSIPVG